MTTNATKKTVPQQVTELVSKQVDIPEERISSASDFQAELGFDSLELAEFLMTVEEQFNIEVSDEAANGIRTVGQAIDAIEQAMAAKRAVPQGT